MNANERRAEQRPLLLPQEPVYTSLAPEIRENNRSRLQSQDENAVTTEGSAVNRGNWFGALGRSQSQENLNALDNRSDCDEPLDLFTSAWVYLSLSPEGEELSFEPARYRVPMLMIILLMVAVGAVFFSLYDAVLWMKALYYAVSVFYRIGFQAPDYTLLAGDDVSRIVTICYLLSGSFVFSILFSASFIRRCARHDDWRRDRLVRYVWVILALILAGAVWAHFSMKDWSIMSAVYFAVSTVFAWGSFSIDISSSDDMFLVVAIYAIIGSLFFFLFTVFLSAEVEVLIEHRILRAAAREQLQEEELQLIYKQRHQRQRRQLPAAMPSQCDDEDDVRSISLDDRTPLTLFEAKLLLLRRVLNYNVGAFYHNARVFIPFVLALLILAGDLFYVLYDNSIGQGRSINHALSAVYKLGNSSFDRDDFSQLVSMFLMLAGYLTFIVMNVSVVRELSLQKHTLRQSHALVMALILLFVVGVAFMMWLVVYDTELWSTGLLQVAETMSGMGSTVLAGNVNYWVVNTYTIVTMPLFAIFLGHIIAEIDVLDQTTLVDEILLKAFDAHDMKLLSLIDMKYDALMQRAQMELKQQLANEKESAAQQLGPGLDEEEGNDAAPPASIPTVLADDYKKLLSARSTVSLSLSACRRTDIDDAVHSPATDRMMDDGVRELFVLLIVRLQDRSTLPLLHGIQKDYLQLLTSTVSTETIMEDAGEEGTQQKELSGDFTSIRPSFDGHAGLLDFEDEVNGMENVWRKLARWWNAFADSVGVVEIFHPIRTANYSHEVD